MNKIQYKIKNKMECKNCNHNGFPYIRMIIFKNSEKFSASAFCQKCGKWIDNVNMEDVRVIKIK